MGPFLVLELQRGYLYQNAVLPNGPFFPDFGPDPDFFGETGPEMVRIGTQKSRLEGQKQRQTTLKAYFNNICRSRSDLAFVINILAIVCLPD